MFLSEKALLIWPRLVTTYQDPGKDKIEVSLGDDFDYSGRNLLSATFNGTPIVSSIWADFVEEVCKLVYAIDPVKFASASKDAERLGFDGFLSVSGEEHSRKISESIYVKTDCDTNRKIWFLKRLFDYLSIDEDCLVISVSSSEKVEVNAEANKRLWSLIIPRLIKATREAGCPSYQNRKPSSSYYLDGFIGTSKMHLVSSFSKKTKKVCAYLYINGGDKAENIRIFNHFLAYKEEIEKAMGTTVRWQAPDERTRCAQIIIEAAVPFIADETKWDEVAEVSSSLMGTLVTGLSPYIESEMQLLDERRKMGRKTKA